MAFGWVQGPASGPATGTTIPGTVAGNFLVVYAYTNGSASPVEADDLYINANVGTQLTWTKVMSAAALFVVFGESYRHTWFISDAIPADVDGDILVSVNSPSGTAGICIHEISCGSAEIHIDGDIAGNGAATVNPSVSLPTTEANGMIFSAITSSHVHPTQGAAYTAIAIPNSSSFQEGEYDLDHGASGSVTVDYVASSTTYLITAFSLQEGAPVGGDVQQPRIMVIN